MMSDLGFRIQTPRAGAGGGTVSTEDLEELWVM